MKIRFVDEHIARTADEHGKVTESVTNRRSHLIDDNGNNIGDLQINSNSVNLHIAHSAGFDVVAMHDVITNFLIPKKK